MKRIFSFLLILMLLSAHALADPIALVDDFAEEITEPSDPEDPSSGTFVYICRFPHVDENAEGSLGINTFYSEQFDYEMGFTMPMNIALYYLLGNYQPMMWLAAMSAVAWYFTKPTLGKMEQEMRPKDPNEPTY